MEIYHKIQTVYKRDPETKFKTLLEGQFSRPEFEYLKDSQWTWAEKIDGTNIRVLWGNMLGFLFKGKTDKAEIPPFLFDKLMETFDIDGMKSVFPDYEEVCLYGEGYGRKIQKGGGYIPDGVGFILFDVRIGDIWLRREDVEDIASKLDIPVTPIIGEGTLLEAVELVKSGFFSHLRDTPAEGLVMRPKVELLDRRGIRVITKLKLKDFA
jgi:ATP-dependent RNA circularization protein (DNA/RNA ligase family)